MVLVNLLAWRERRRRRLLRRLLALSGGLLGCGVGVMGLLGVLLTLRLDDVQRLKPQLDAAWVTLHRTVSLQQQRLEQSRQQMLCQRLFAQRQAVQQQWLRFWQSLPQQLPANLWLTGLSFQEQRLVLRGESLTAVAVEQFRRQMAPAAPAPQPKVRQIKRSSAGQYQFTLNLNVPNIEEDIFTPQQVALCTDLNLKLD